MEGDQAFDQLAGDLPEGPSPVSRVASEGSPRAPVRLQSGPDPGSASKMTGW
jgi:hypothetical protein